MKDVYGTITKLDAANKKIEIRVEERGADVTVPLTFGEASHKWYLSHTSDFPVGQVVIFSAGKGELFKMKPAQQKPTHAQKANETLINEKLKAAGLPQNPVETDASVRMTGVQVIGNHDPTKIIEKKLRCHINLGNYELLS